MTIYVVSWHCYDDFEVINGFTDSLDAQAFCDERNATCTEGIYTFDKIHVEVALHASKQD